MSKLLHCVHEIVLRKAVLMRACTQGFGGAVSAV